MQYEDHLRTVGLTTVEKRRLRADMIEVYKILRELNKQMRLKNPKKGVTRGHDLKLFKKRVNLDARKFCFGNCVCGDWNRLPG